MKQLLSVENLMATARTEAGIDIEDVDAIEPLTKIVDTYNTEIEFHAHGYQFVINNMVRMLANRLRLQRDFAAHPEINEQPIEAPIIICGMPRTGSTLLHKMLAASDDFNYLTGWTTLNPASYTGIPNEDVAPRVADCDEFVAYLNEYASGFQNMHEITTHEPEEEVLLMQHCLRTTPHGLAFSPSLIQWCIENNSFQWQMEELIKSLKYLQWQGLASANKRWLLKAPNYMGMEQALNATFPDATLITTHRHPAKVVPSLAKLYEGMQKAVSDTPIDPFIHMGAVAFQMDQYLANREQIPMIDVHFRRLLGNTEAVLKQLYSYAEQPLADDSLQKMLAWKESSAAHAKGKVSYSLADYNLTESAIDEQFSNYIQLLNDLFD